MEVFAILVGTFVIAGILGNTKFSKSSKSGKEGEKRLTTFLKRRSEGVLINNFIFKLNNSYCQIDHIFITDKAIFVIETKNHSGFILGDEESLNWTVMYGAKKFSMYNPLKQNSTHAKMLRDLLQDNTAKIIPITIFSNNKCKLQNTINGVYTLDEFKNNFLNIINIRGSISKKKYYNKINEANLSGSIIQRFKQVRYAKSKKKAIIMKK